ncbi:MAG: winged helix-turn-helix transcriptional regulator [Alphaproteobacteria bacterium]|nr:winged helix-turn-helix transcriptional regulator [Alphaproteobacteria bacterium]
MKKNDAISALGALAQETRLDIFRLLVRSASMQKGEGGLAAGEIARQLQLPAPTLSFHLKEMARADLVRGDRRGRSIVYEPQIAVLRDVAEFLLNDCCQGVSSENEEISK